MFGLNLLLVIKITCMYWYIITHIIIRYSYGYIYIYVC